MNNSKKADLVGNDKKNILQNKAVLAVAAVLAIGGDNVAIWFNGHDCGKQENLTEIVTNDSTIQAQPVDVGAIIPGTASRKMVILQDTSLKQEIRDSLLRISYIQDSTDNANHDTIMQIPPQSLPKVQIPSGMIATVSVILSDLEGGNPVVVQSKKVVVEQVDTNLCTDIYAGFYIAQNQPKDK
jgi:hypothetical protein